MKTHPTDMLPAYVLGVLDEADAQRVGEHLALCPTCREIADDFRASITLPPGLSPHTKQRLMERVHHDTVYHAAGYRRKRRPAVALGVRWSSMAAVMSLLLALVFGALTISTRQELARAQQTIQVLQAGVATEREPAVVALLSLPGTVNQPLTGSQPGVMAAMYVQPGHHQGVLLASGLPPAASGTIYQCWFARGTTQISAGVFSVDADGVAQVVLDAPAPIHSYYEVMVTVEPSGGSATPSDQVVLSGRLAS